MGDKKSTEKKPKKDFKEVRPPIDTGGLTFDQMLKKVGNADPKKVKALEEHNVNGSNRTNK